MADQDNKSKMAIPNQPRDLARKLVKIDLAPYALGADAKAGVKKFGDAHPTLRLNQPNQSPKENQDTFDGGAVKDDTTRRADYEIGQDEPAYKNAHGETKKAAMKKKVVESFVAKTVRKVKVEPINAQKKGAMTSHGAEHETSEIDGDETSEKQQKKPHIKLPAQVVAKEAYLSELGEPMSPAPATSDSPGFGGSAPADQPGQDKDTGNNSSESGDHDDEEADESVTAARDLLEVIATQAAELYENIEDSTKLPSHIVEKLELAKNFVTSVAKHMSDTKDEDSNNQDTDEKDDGSSNKDNVDTQKPTAFKGNGQQSLAKESFSSMANKAAKKYGSKESGEKVAGAILAKIRANHGAK